MNLKTTTVHLDPADYKRLAKVAGAISEKENRRVTTSELIRRAIREFLERQ
jgi:predicted transcriptional regulator